MRPSTIFASVVIAALLFVSRPDSAGALQVGAAATMQDSAQVRELMRRLEQLRAEVVRMEREIATLRGLSADARRDELALRERELALQDRLLATRQRDSSLSRERTAAELQRAVEEVRRAAQSNDTSLARVRAAAELQRAAEELRRASRSNDTSLARARAMVERDMVRVAEELQRAAMLNDSAVARVRAALERDMARVAEEQARIAELRARAARQRDTLNLDSTNGASRTLALSPPSGNVLGSYLVLNDPEFMVREPWAPEDAADSLYRVGISSMTRGDNRRASEVFAELVQKYPASLYAADAFYYRAMALYRIGGTGELKSAVASLDQLVRDHPDRSSQTDVKSLRTRVLGGLSSAGDHDATAQMERMLRREASSCEQDELSARLVALSNLSGSTPDSVATELRALLNRRDDCSANARLNALMLVQKQELNPQLEMLGNVIRNDPSLAVKQQALEWYGRLPADRTIALQEELLRSTRETVLQDQVVRQLATHNLERSQQLLREAIESPHLATRTRASAIDVLRRSERDADREYLDRVATRLNDSTLMALLGGQDQRTRSVQELRSETASLAAALTDMRDRNASSLRQAELAAGTAPVLSMPIDEVSKRFDSSTEAAARLRLVEVLGARSENAATDKLVAIAKDTRENAGLRRAAIAALASKSDARSQRMLLELIVR